MRKKSAARSLAKLATSPSFAPKRGQAKAKGKRKFYAVRKGHVSGIFDTWAECQKQVAKFSRPEFKSFATKSEAEHYLEEGKIFDRVTDEVPPDVLHVYTDGSLNTKTQLMGGGMYAKTQGGKELRMFLGIDSDIFSEIGPDANQGKPSSSFAELIAAVIAVKRLTALGYKKLQLHVDNDGVRNWFTGAWQAKQPSTRCALNALFSAQYDCNYLSIVSVDGHSGDVGNNEADRLAGIYTQPRYSKLWVKSCNGVVDEK